MAPQYKLTYFNSQGLGEPIRLIFTYSNIPFEDIRVTREEWVELKKTAQYKKMPTLEVDGKLMHQSKAIARYLARKHNLAGKDDWESFQCDAIVDTFTDVLMEMAHSILAEDEQKKKELMEKFKTESVPAFLNDMEKLIAKNGGHLVGSKISWADFYVVCLLDTIGMHAKEDMFTHFAGMKKLKEKIYSVPSIAAWKTKRPATEFF